MQFEFATAARLLFGPGTRWEVPAAAAALGKQALLVTGRSFERAEPLLDRLRTQGVAVTTFSVAGEPTLETVQQGVELARARDCRLVIGLGGGSVIDTGKAIAVLHTNTGDLFDYLEIIGQGQPLTQPGVPYIAIPTTAGSGAEVTRNAVLASVERRVKVSLRSPFMLPRLAVVDPELTYSLPPAVTAATGLDALTQLLEPYVSASANPLTDALCREGLRRVGGALRRAYADGADTQARQDMSLAALLGGLALANAKLGAVHGLAGSLGGMLHAPHGAICARLLPLVVEANLRALKERAPTSPALARYGEAAQLLTGKPSATAADGVEWLFALCRDLAIPGLAQFGLTDAALPQVAAQAQKASSMKGNPLPLTDGELRVILGRAL